LWADNSSDAILDFEVNLKEVFLKNDDGLHECYAGFTASTGFFYSSHQIHSFYLNPLFFSPKNFQYFTDTYKRIITNFMYCLKRNQHNYRVPKYVLFHIFNFIKDFD
jgi:hypothetical protein